MSYPDAFPKDAFEVHTSITHTPTNTKFVQQGGRVIILRLDDHSGLYRCIDSITDNDLQQFGVVLTKGKLIKLAIAWLKDNA